MFPSPRLLAFRPALEALEDRTAPAVLDLTARGSLGELGGAIFRQADPQPTGSGVIDSFVRVQAHGAKQKIEHGYNSDARPVQLDEDHSRQRNHAIQLDAIPRVTFGGRAYREFLLDINQNSKSPLLSLDEVRIYVADSPTLSGYNAANGTLGGQPTVFNLDATDDNWVKLDYRLNSGSGSGDMFMYIPETAFAGASAGAFVYLYSKFGLNHAANAGFEEWAAGVGQPVSASGTIAGTKFHDIDNDGVRDPGEKGLEGFTIFIDADGDDLLDEGEVFVVTDAIGAYAFTNLLTGMGSLSTYRIREVPIEGWLQTTPDPDPIVLTLAGQLVEGIDFGNWEDNYGQGS